MIVGCVIVSINVMNLTPNGSNGGSGVGYVIVSINVMNLTPNGSNGVRCWICNRFDKRDEFDPQWVKWAVVLDM